MIALLLSLSAIAFCDEGASEEDYYEVISLPAPEGCVLEVGGIALLPDGRPIVCTRRGEMYVVDHAYGDGSDAKYTLWAEGLQEPLGLLVHDGWIYTAQRGEVSRMRDVDGDDRMDELETVCDAWHISGNYHEYNFGPRIGPDGRLWITLNKPFGNEPFGRVDWRGFALSIGFDGSWKPVACGLRSPAGIQNSPAGQIFYTDNQGEWCGASKLSHVEPGDFHGHPWGTFSCKLDEWTFPAPAQPPDGRLMPLVPTEVPSFKLPAVWFPYDKMGKSPSGFVWDETQGRFGPFAGQLFVGDQHHAWVMRVSLEEVRGHWQGACYPFRGRLASGVIRVAWGADDSLLVGMSDRGWASKGRSPQGLQRIRWRERMPFEIRTLSATPDGFLLEFTQPPDRATLTTEAFRMESYTYELHAAYGSAEMDRADVEVKSIEFPSASSCRIQVLALRAGYVHELHLSGVLALGGAQLLHPEAYYTLIEIPEEGSLAREPGGAGF